MAEQRSELNHEQFTVGWICALDIELAAADVMMDERYDGPLRQDPNDHNNYCFGRIGNHKIVYACTTECGTTSAATLANQMSRSFPLIKLGLMVGIGGGVPTSENDMRLGDVVVSKPDDCFGGVVQYDMGKRTPEGKFQRTGQLNKPPSALRSALNVLKMEQRRKRFRLEDLLYETYHTTHDDSLKRPDERDDLFAADYQHPGSSRECSGCDRSRIMERSKQSGPKIHYGTIASGNSVIKDAVQRDKISSDLGGVKCFEMEAAGLMDHFPCLVIRGICDYADSHKNDAWHRYAATTAAAYGKKLLLIIPSRKVEQTMTAQQRKLSVKERALPSPEPPNAQQFAADPYQYQFTAQRSSFQQMTPPQEQQRSLMDGSLNPYPFGMGIGGEPQPSPGFSPPPDQYQAFSYNGEASAQQSGPQYPFDGSSQNPSQSAQTDSFLPDQLQPGINRPSPYPSQNTSQRLVEGIPSNQLQRPSTLNQVGHSDSELARLGGKSWNQAGMPRVPVGSQPGRNAGYQQPFGMAYAQPSRTNHPTRPGHPNQTHSGPPIPLKDLPRVHADSAAKRPFGAPYLAPHAATSSKPHLAPYPTHHSSSHSATHSTTQLGTHTAAHTAPHLSKHPAKHLGSHSPAHSATHLGVGHKIKHGLGHGKKPKPSKKSHQKKAKAKHPKHDKEQSKKPGAHHASDHSHHGQHASNSSDEGHSSDTSDDEENTYDTSDDEGHTDGTSDNENDSTSEGEAEESDRNESFVDIDSDDDIHNHSSGGHGQYTGNVASPPSYSYENNTTPHYPTNGYDHHDEHEASSPDAESSDGFHQAEPESEPSEAPDDVDDGSNDWKEDEQSDDGDDGDDGDDCCGDCCCIVM